MQIYITPVFDPMMCLLYSFCVFLTARCFILIFCL